MRLIPRNRAAVLLCVLVTWLVVPADAQDRSQAGPASAVIAGRVVAADTGTPVRGAQVRLRSTGTGTDVRLVTTDDQGTFEARNLFAGGWVLSASKNGFTTTRYGQRRSTDDGTPVVVSNGQRATVSIALTRGGVITGRALDEFGEPLLGARIQATRSRIVRGVRQLMAVGASDITDDTGAFRLFGLPPGTYYVAASLRAAAPDSDTLQTTVGGISYYPGTADVGEAVPITLRPGDETSISFPMSPVRSVRVSGVVLGANGAPAADAEVHLMRMDATQVGTTVGNFGRSGPDGSFTVIDVPPGQYVINAARVPSFTLPPPRGFVPADNVEETIQSITVGLEDVSGVTLAMTNGVTVNGIVETDNGTPLPSPLRFEVMVTPAYAIGRGPNVIQVTKTAGQRATFQIPRLWGAVYFGAMLPDGVMLRAIELNGTDVTDQPVELRGPSPELRLVLTSRVTEVSGVVTSSGAPVPNASIVVFADDQRRWTYPSRFIARVDADNAGRFTIRNLPGDTRYLVAIVAGLDDGEEYDPERLKSLRDRATSFTLGDGERKSLTLTPER